MLRCASTTPRPRLSGDAELAAEQAEQTMLTAHTFSSLRRRWLRSRYSSNSQQATQHALRSFNANRTPALLSSWTMHTLFACLSRVPHLIQILAAFSTCRCAIRTKHASHKSKLLPRAVNPLLPRGDRYSRTLAQANITLAVAELLRHHRWLEGAHNEPPAFKNTLMLVVWDLAATVQAKLRHWRECMQLASDQPSFDGGLIVRAADIIPIWTCEADTLRNRPALTQVRSRC